MASLLAARQTLNLARLSASRSAAASVVQRRGFSAAAGNYPLSPLSFQLYTITNTNYIFINLSN